jgi:hypothetical protein
MPAAGGGRRRTAGHGYLLSWQVACRTRNHTETAWLSGEMVPVDRETVRACWQQSLVDKLSNNRQIGCASAKCRVWLK